jgi:hypothetical protein
MPYACRRALRLSALLVLPASALAQTAKSPTIFSASTQVGTVNLRAAVVRTDYTVQPLPLLKVVALRTDRPDSAVAETDLDGRAVLALRVGTYTLRAKTAQPVAGRSFTWAVRVVVRPQRTEAVQLTNSNAMISDSVATTLATTTQASPRVAAAPRPTPPVAAEASPFTPPAKPIEKPAEAPAKRAEMPVKQAVAAKPRVNTSGLLLGLSFDASSIRSDDFSASTESGPGAAAQIGWGITKNFAFVLDASGARISSLGGDYNLAHVDVGGRWHFVNRSAFVPFVDVGYAGRALTKQDALLADGSGTTYTGDVAVLGGGVSFGGGFQYFPTRSWALGGAFKWTTGRFDRVKVDNVTIDGWKIDATSARFNMGFTWYPTGR